MKTAIILGGGVGGLVAAQRLRRLAPGDARIIVIDRDADHVFAPSLLWVATGTRTQSSITRPLSRLARKGIEFINATVTEIDVDSRSVRLDDRLLNADALIIALGAATDASTIPGLRELGLNIYSPGGATQINEQLQAFDGGSISIVTSEPMYKCPAAPYELAFLTDDLLRRRGIRERSNIEFIAAEPAPMATAGPSVSQAMRSMLVARDITYTSGTTVISVAPATRTLALADGSDRRTDLLFYVPAHRPPAVILDLPIADASGWLTVDRHTLATSAPGVYALGDVAAIPLDNGRMLPKAGIFAHAQAEVVARNLAAEWSASTPVERFDGHGSCFVEVGGGRAAAGVGNFYATPNPDIRMVAPGRWAHLKKVLFEKYWLHHWA